jgi:hypothetical protein
MLKLYRADFKGNKTMPEKFATDGLLTKQVNSRDHPNPHEKYGWTQTIKNHIRFTNDLEKFIYDTTQYLSFTTDIKRAEAYLASDKNRKYKKSFKDKANAFLFSATIEVSEMIPIGNGVFMFLYPCNYNKTRSDPKFITSLSGLIGCDICSFDKYYKHRLLIIDTKTYLSSFKESYLEEYYSALKDKEWLFMPVDPMIGLNAIGYQSRIPIADFWTVDFFEYE